MVRKTPAELEAELARLHRENTALRAAVGADADAAGAADGPRPGLPDTIPPHRRSRGWAVLSATLIVVGLVLAPVAVVSSWARVQLSSTEQFVSTFAPLSDEPAVQEYVSAEVVAAIEEQVDLPAIMADLFDGIGQLGLPPRAAAALALLEAPAAAGVQNLVSSAVDRLVASEAFGDLWAQTLRLSHRQLTATLQGDPDAALAISGSGELGVQIGPIIDEVKKRLVDRGFGFAASIPTVDRTIVIATADAFTTVQLVYGLAIAAGTWLPFVALGLLAAGVLIARRRVSALIATAVALGVVMLLLAAGFGIARLYFVASVSPAVMPSTTANVVFEQVVGLMRSTTVALIVLALAIALIAWFTGPYALPTKLRGFLGSGLAGVRTSAEARGISTGRFGLWMYRQRVLVRVVIGVAAAAVLFLSRPLDASTVVWTAVVALLAVLLAELLQHGGPAVDRGVPDGVPEPVRARRGEAVAVPGAEAPAAAVPPGSDNVV